MTNRNDQLDVICYGAVSLDNIIRVPHLPRPDTPVPALTDYYRLAGEALETALSLATWEYRVGVVGNYLGEDPYADYITRELERFPGIAGDGIERDPRVRTPFRRIVVTPDGQRHILDYWRESSRYRTFSHDMLQSARVFSTDAHGGQERVDAAIVARDAGLVTVVSDVVSPDHPLLPLSDWVIVGDAFLREHIKDVDPEQHLLSLQVRAPGATFVLTSGPNPLRVLTPEGRWLIVPPYPLPPLDRHGAGNVFKAGIIRSILEALPLLESVRFANAAAALWVAQPAAVKHPPSLSEIATLQEERGARPVVVSQQEEEKHCPICQRVVANTLFEKHWRMDPRVIRALRDRYPAWRRADGACPVCVSKTVQQVGLTRAIADIPQDLVDHPIYGQGEPHALPTGVRLRANPHYKGRDVTLAFLDSGFYPHKDLTQPENRVVEFVDATTDNIRVGADFSVPQPSSWHGMMTSVVAAGNGFLSHGYYAGLASQARLLLVKVSDSRGRVHEHDILRGMRWLAEHWREYGIQVLNLSVGGEPGLRPESELNRLVNRLVDEGLVIVVAAGNVGRDDLCPPASATGAITVGGLDDRNTLDPSTNRMWHSNWGRIGEDVLKPELIAPSIWLAAPVLPGTPIAEQNAILERLRRTRDTELPDLLGIRLHDLGFDPALRDEPVEAMRMAVLHKLIANKFISPFYQHVDGTSFAAPIVASVVAQMLEANPSLTPQRVKELLIATAEPLPGVPEYQQGYGVVVPGRAVAAALRERYGHYKPGNLSPQVEQDSVRFILYEPRAQSVNIIGQWNEWGVQAQPMQEREPGIWVAEMPPLPPGRYPYKFVIDDERWLDDPENLMKAVDGYGGFNSVLVIPA